MHLGVSDLARRAATSIRSISRMFPVETGLTFKAWRQRARIALAIDQLSAGRAISQVAADVGFGSTEAFSFAVPASNEDDTDHLPSSSPNSGYAADMRKPSRVGGDVVPIFIPPGPPASDACTRISNCAAGGGPQ